MKTFLSLAFALLTVGVVAGQTFNDVLRYSTFTPQGSARFAGTGGSLTPMGVDLTTLHTNPAGIGWNRYNLAQITPGFSFTNTNGSLFNSVDGGDMSEAVANFTLPSAGALFAGSTRSVNWSTFNFGISLTRLADLNQQIRFEGRTPGSIIEGFADDINDGAGSEYGSNLALDDYFFIEDGFYFTDFYDFGTQLPRVDPINRNGLYDRRGSINELAFGIGGNYRETVLWGLSLGIPFLSYDEVLTYEEVDDEDTVPGFINSSYDQNLNAGGTGVNFKFGLIGMPTERIRVSAAIHSPTFWAIDEQYNTSFGYFFSDENDAVLGGTELSPLGSFAYNLRTPWRFQFGAGTLVGSRGFVSVDADYVNYSGNDASFEDFSAPNEALNADIDNILGSSLGVRFGGELNVDPLQVRAGVGYRQIPYTDFAEDIEDTGILTYSGGVGYSVGKFFVDLAAQASSYSTFQEPYSVFSTSGQTVVSDRTRVSVLLSVGLRGWGTGF